MLLQNKIWSLGDSIKVLASTETSDIYFGELRNIPSQNIVSMLHCSKDRDQGSDNRF